MAALFGEEHEPRVLRLCQSDSEEDVDLLYVRVHSRFSNFLQHDTADSLGEPGSPLEEDLVQDLTSTPGGNDFQQRFITMKHPKLPSSDILVCPERDVLWLNFDDDEEDLEEMSRHYGTQLSAIRNVIFEQTEWDDIDACLNQLQHFPGVQTIYVWLSSHLHLAGETPATEKEYFQEARAFQARDYTRFEERNVTVQYIDYERNLYGGFMRK
ncbi:hypothetical protein NQ176_g10811 [Zarea fungicola]|uniref:Uncharacterized protein n=1 Tax=Zarea fungicola TaxID=93591 RepID=A0ACC1MFN0_9HYPO|nr:hypothetical protein NQ176_g10811 [Lecanicillium fungicola]